MRDKVKNIIYRFFLLIRDILNIFINFREISVICYHSISEEKLSLAVSPKVFDEQISFLKKNKYVFVTIDDIIDFINKKKFLPKKAVAITFDDGYADLYFNALPILKKYKIPVTIFIVLDKLAFKNNTGVKLDLLSTLQIKEMKRHNIDFQFHSKSHLLLDRLTTKEMKSELFNDENFNYFAYPGGHYAGEAIEALKLIGFKGAFTIRPGLIKNNINPFLINRNVILRSMPLWQFKIRITKAIDWYFNFSRRVKKFYK